MKMPAQRPYQSKQDVATPKEFLDAVREKYGPILFDLAAHAGNHVCENYFAPKELKYIYDPKKNNGFVTDIVAELVKAGGIEEEIKQILETKYNIDTAYGMVESDEKLKIIVPNRDPNCRALDSLAQNWNNIKSGGVWWLNPEYENIGPWAEKSRKTNPFGVITMLIPSSTGTEYWANDIHEKAWVDFLSPRISFDGIAPYPKDLSLVVYGLNKIGYGCWRWK